MNIAFEHLKEGETRNKKHGKFINPYSAHLSFELTRHKLDYHINWMILIGIFAKIERNVNKLCVSTRSSGDDLTLFSVMLRKENKGIISLQTTQGNVK